MRDVVTDIGTAMERAIALAGRDPAPGPNPRVGCVLVGPAGPEGRREVLGEGFHRGAGTAHAEVAALADARARGADPRGATAVVTLEPCSHRGRTGPCTEALIDAGIDAVHYAVDDPNPTAAGGARTLRAAGIAVTGGTHAGTVEDMERAWLTAVRRGTPYVTAKMALSLDGRVAAADGTSRWITGGPARAHAHEVRATVDAIAVGTGTLLADDPALTARTTDGSLAGSQPARVVVGLRDVPPGSRVTGPGGRTVHLRTRDPHAVVASLGRDEARHLLVEGGPGLLTAFLRAGLVDEIHAYVAPVLLGAGRPVVGDLALGTLADAPRWRTAGSRRLGDDLFMMLRRDGGADTAHESTREEP